MIQLDLAADLPRIPVDGIQIRQVLTNLVQNAFEALDATPVYKHRLKIRAVQISGTEIEVAVIDNGPGVADAELTRIFEPFVTTRRERTGMGLPAQSCRVDGP